MKTKVNTARTRLLAVSIALAAAMGAALTANAGTVNNSVNKDDPRYMTTGCKYESAFASGAGSIGVWVKNVTEYSTATAPSCLFGSCHVNTGTSNDQGLLLCIDYSSGNFCFWVAGSKNGAVSRNSVVATGTSSKLNDGSWHFLLGTFDRTSGKMYFYVDGTAAGSADIDIDGLASARCFAIAGVGKKSESTATENEKYGAGFKGYYAEATLWNKALTSEEVATLYTRRAYPWDDGLIGYWPLAGTTANLAQNAVTRADGSRPNALCYYRSTVTDADFFDNPPTRFVASVEWVAEKGYVPPAGATFNNPDAPATNIAEAIATASADNTIYLMPGTHRISEQVDITKANLTLTGKYLGFSGGEVVIDAQGLCRHFRSSSDYSGQDGWVFDGLKLVNGRAGEGGSIYAKSKTGKILSCVFEDNAATNGSGGAYYSYAANGSVISNCVFRCNSATSDGGAAYTQQNSKSFDDRQNFIGCTFSNNVARAGGGVYAERCVLIDGCLFKDNAATNGTKNSNCRGGHARFGNYSRILNSEFTGACMAKGYGSCLDCGSTDSVVSNCVFRGMTASDGYAMFHVGARTLFVNSIITNNNNSGMIFFPETAADLVVRQSLFAGNTENQAVVWDWRSSLRFENCTILQQNFRAGGGGSGTNVLVNCILPNADITSGGAYVNILTNCLVKSVSGGTLDSGVITGGPKFVDAANGNYRLSATSPCREKGRVLDWMTAGATDLDGNPRLANILGKVAADALPDLGCYECQEKGLVPMVIIIR